MTSKNRVDIAILVPKEDELRSLEWAFEKTFARSDGKLSGGKLYYLFNYQMQNSEITTEVSVAVVFIHDQGNSIAGNVTEQVLSQLDPIIVFLTGTAAGRSEKTTIGSVVISSLVTDAQEWKIGESTTPRIRQYEPPEEIRTDVERFIGKNLSRCEWRDKLLAIPQTLYGDVSSAHELWEQSPEANINGIASSNYLQLQPEFLDKLWNVDDRIRCIDMESGGFGKACSSKPVQRQWLIIRGISDYGTTDSRRQEYRIASAASAAILLRMFIEKGFVECHPHWLRVPEAGKLTLSEDNFFAKFNSRTAIVDGIRERLGIDMGSIELGRSLSIADLEALCVARGADKNKAYQVLSEIREVYFTTKYRDYSYENDIRGLIPHWSDEMNNILKNLGIEKRSSVVLNVGAGNGLELPFLFADAGELIAVDISKEMLEEAKRKIPTICIFHNAAEDLRDIKTDSIDIYASLRTYQSSFFDISAALREAQRVLKSRGVLVVSIANGFVDQEDGIKKVIRGLLVPGSRRSVDRDTPRRTAEQVVDKLMDFGFEGVGYISAKTDIYIWGQKP